MLQGRAVLHRSPDGAAGLHQALPLEAAVLRDGMPALPVWIQEKMREIRGK